MRWSLATQLRLGFAAALFLVFGVSGATWWIALNYHDEIDAAYETLVAHHMAGVVEVSRNDTVAIVAVVGDGVLDASNLGSAIASRALSAALAGGVRVTLAAAGASEVAAYMLVERSDRRLALSLIHAEFFGPK